MRARFQACDLLLRMIGEFKVSRDRFRRIFVFSLYVTNLFSESSLSDLPVCQRKLFAKSASYAISHICWGTGEMISDLDGSFGSRYFRRVANERTWFALWACPFKSSGLISCLKCTSELKVTYLLATYVFMGGMVALWWERSTPERAVRARALARNIVFCSWARHFNHIASLHLCV